MDRRCLRSLRRAGIVAGILLAVGAIALAVPVLGATIDGEISFSGEEATDGSTWIYEINDLEAVEDLSVELTGSRVTESRSTSKTTEDGVFSVEPRGTSDPENAEMTLEGVRSEDPGSTSGTLDDGEIDSFDVGGNNEPENAEVTISADVTESSDSESGSDGSSISLSHSSDTVDIDDTTVSTTDFEESETYEFLDPDEESISVGESHSVTYSDVYDEIDSVRISNEFDGQYELTLYIDGEKFDSGTYDHDGDGDVVFTGDPISVSGDFDVTVENNENDDDDSRLFFTWGDGSEYSTQINTVGTDSVTFSSSSDSTTIHSSYSSRSLDYEMGETISVYVDGPGASYQAEYIEVSGVEDPSVDVGSSTVSHSGVIDGSTTETVDLSTGSETIDASYTGESNGLDYSIEWTEVTTPQNPSLDLAGESVVHSGELADGETVTETVDLSTGETYSGEISSEGPVKASVEWVDVSDTVDPEISLNGETDGIDGTLPEGETETLDLPVSAVEEGSNVLEVGLADSNGGPEAQVGVEFSHTARTSASATVNSTTWEERVEVSREFETAQSDVSLTVIMPSNVVEVGEVEVDRGDGFEEVPTEEVDLDGTDMIIPIGSVSAGEEISVRAVGSKIRVLDGEISVVEPTPEGLSLSTKVEVEEVSEEGTLLIDVTSTSGPDEGRMIWAEEITSQGPDPFVRVSETAVKLGMNSAPGATFVAVDTGLLASSQSGTAEIRSIEEDPEEESITFSVDMIDGFGLLTVEPIDSPDYHVLESSEGRLVSEGFESLELRDSGSYVIKPSSPSSILGGGVIGGENLGFIPSFVWLLGAVVGSLGTLAFLGRRLGGDGGRVLLAGGSAVVGVVALELVTAYSLVDTAISGAFSSTTNLLTAVGSGTFAALVVSLGVPLALVALDQRTEIEVPLPLYVGSGLAVAFTLIETVAPGAVSDALGSGLEEVSALLWLLLIGGPIVLIALWLRSRRPEIVIGGDA